MRLPLRWLRPLALHPAASRRVLQLAYPIVLGSLSVTLLSVVDTAMLGRLGPAPLAASGVAGVLFLAIVFPLTSIGVGVQALTARRHGEGRQDLCGDVAGDGLRLALLIGLPIVALAPLLARWFGPILSGDPEVVALGREYLHYRLLGAGFMFVNWAFRGFYAGIGETRHQMIASILITAVNVGLDYVLIFGHGTAPLGIRGAAIASTAAVGVGTLYFTFVALTPAYRATYALPRGLVSRPRWAGRIVRLSLPVVAQRIISHGSWFVFFTVMARIGTVELAASNVMRSIYNLSIMIAVGMGTAGAALLGQSLGARRADDAEQLAWEAAKLSAYAMAIVGVLFVIAPDWVFRIYTSDPTVIAVGRLPLALLGPVQALAGIGLVLSQALQGAGNTRFVMIAELAICGLFYLPTVYFLGLRTPLGMIGAWSGEYIYWALLAIVMFVRFRQGRWRSIEI